MKKKMKKTLLLSSLILASAGITACAEKIPPEQAVKERAEARWAIRLTGTTDGLYEFLSPAKRQILTKSQYEGGFGHAVSYLGAEVKSVTCHNNAEKKADTCTVKMKIDLSSMISGAQVKSTSIVTETWVYQDGEWWVAK